VSRKPATKPARKASAAQRRTLAPGDAAPVLQQDARGFSVGDVVADRAGALYIVRDVTASPPALAVECLPGDVGALDTAMRAFRRFTAHGVGSVETLPAPPAPGVLYVLGELADVSYIAKRGGRVNTYLHAFKKSARPRLACSHDGQSLYILGGGYRVTSHGIVG